jgi:hypothetical protein
LHPGWGNEPLAKYTEAALLKMRSL